MLFSRDLLKKVIIPSIFGLEKTLVTKWQKANAQATQPLPFDSDDMSSFDETEK